MINVKETKEKFLMMLVDKNIKKILDLGCGYGKMSKFFDKSGAKSVGIDIKKLPEDSENFKFVEGDIRKEDFGENNNLVIASLVLHFFEQNEALKIIERMKIATSEKGYNFLILMKDENNLKKFYPTFEEIFKIYNNWSLIKKIEGITQIEDHDNLGPHQHNLIFLLFQKLTD